MLLSSLMILLMAVVLVVACLVVQTLKQRMFADDGEECVVCGPSAFVVEHMLQQRASALEPLS